MAFVFVIEPREFWPTRRLPHAVRHWSSLVAVTAPGGLLGAANLCSMLVPTVIL